MYAMNTNIDSTSKKLDISSIVCQFQGEPGVIEGIGSGDGVSIYHLKCTFQI